MSNRRWNRKTNSPDTRTGQAETSRGWNVQPGAIRIQGRLDEDSTDNDGFSAVRSATPSVSTAIAAATSISTSIPAEEESSRSPPVGIRSAVSERRVPHDTPEDDSRQRNSVREHRLSRRHLVEEKEQSSDEAIYQHDEENAIHATLVTEPPLVVASVATDTITQSPEDMNTIDERIQQALARERKRTIRRLAVGFALLVMAVIVGIVVATVVVPKLQEENDASTSTGLPREKDPATIAPSTSPSAFTIHSSSEEPAPFAGWPSPCQFSWLEVTVDASTGCELPLLPDKLLGNLWNNTNASELVTLPVGPYSVGKHKLEVMFSGSLLCRTTLHVVDPFADWKVLSRGGNRDKNSYYRVRGACREQNWEDAKSMAETSNLCGHQAHLATLTTNDENRFVQNLVRNIDGNNADYWLGGFQPETAEEPNGGWTWVGNEGTLDDTFDDFSNNEPNDGGSGEDCLAMRLGKGFRWDDQKCHSTLRYIEEVNLQNTVVIDGCDSGIAELLANTSACTFVIGPAVLAACDTRQNSANFSTCAETVLDKFVEQGVLSTLEKESILNCDPNNQAPIAICKDAEFTTQYGEPVSTIEPSVVDNGSFDSDGDTLELVLEPAGPFSPGIHTVTLTVLDGRGRFDTCSASVTVDDGNLPPVVQCRELVEVWTGRSDCASDIALSVQDIQLSSFDPENGPLTFELTPSGPFALGAHSVSLEVTDERGASTTCESELLVRPNSTQATEWVSFGTHAYRLPLCPMDYASAVIVSQQTQVCGMAVHLVTVTSEEEHNFLRDDLIKAFSLERETFWLGASQVPGSSEPFGGWTWVNGEGLVYDGYTNWDDGEPNRAAEDCMIMHGDYRGFRWDDQRCSRRYRYIEEVDIDVLPDGKCLDDGVNGTRKY